MIEIELPKENGEQNIIEENKLLSTNSTVEMENRKAEGLITYSLDQQILKFQNKWTIDAILQHMGFYYPTENPCAMVRENLETKSSEYIVICEDELYIASQIPEELLHIYKTNARSIFIYKVNIHMVLVEQ